MPLTPGTLLNERYRVVATLGQGGMGAVYRAEDSHLGVAVAIKENLYLTDEYSRQFQREAKILASLRHPALPRVSDYFVIPGQGQYLIMEFIEGEDLRQRIERLGYIPDSEAAVIGIVICDAITYLHDRPQTIIHRDIKPGNIKITPEGEIVLVDFGLAKVIETGGEDENQDTQTGARAMTPGYSPPEQYGTARTDPRSDIYALGATLYAALTGIIPEDGLSRATGKVILTPIRQIKPYVNHRFSSVIEKALEVDPDDRYQKARDFRNSLISNSELTINSLERLTISPPPSADGELETSGSSLAQNSNFKLARNNTPGRLPHQKWTWPIPPWVPASLILGFIIIVFLLSPGQSYFQMAVNSLFVTAQPPQNTPQVGPHNPTILPTASTPPQNTSPTISGSENTPSIPLSGPSAVQTIEPKIGAGNGRIAFVSDRTGTLQIWTMTVNGDDQIQLTNIDGGVCQPTYSPDGKKLAVISPCKDKRIIYEDAKILILDANGFNPEELPINPGGGFDPAWSHDGTKIAFTSLRNENHVPHIFSYDFNKKTIEELSDTHFADINPAWNVGDKQLAFSRLNNPAYHIWTMSETGTTQFQFSSSGDINDYFTDWAHNGEFIIFSRSPNDTNVPYLYRLNYKDRNTGNEIRILPNVKNSIPIYRARISFDDKWITFESWPDGHNHDIFLMDIQGNNFVRLTNDPGFDFDPAWVPIPNQN